MRLIGYAEGIEVLFDFYPPNTFKAEIPKKLNGIYVLELHAIDEAGNQNNYTNMVITIDFNQLAFKILKQDFLSNENKNDFQDVQEKQRFITAEEETPYSYNSLQPTFAFKELVICL